MQNFPFQKTRLHPFCQIYRINHKCFTLNSCATFQAIIDIITHNTHLCNFQQGKLWQKLEDTEKEQRRSQTNKDKNTRCFGRKSGSFMKIENKITMKNVFQELKIAHRMILVWHWIVGVSINTNAQNQERGAKGSVLFWLMM